MEHLGIADHLHNWTLSIQLDKKKLHTASMKS